MCKERGSDVETPVQRLGQTFLPAGFPGKAAVLKDISPRRVGPLVSYIARTNMKDGPDDEEALIVLRHKVALSPARSFACYPPSSLHSARPQDPLYRAPD